MYKPLVSIIIPVYNGSDYLREAIDSALSQTYDAIEVIVVNDGSNDMGKTDRIARSYGDRIRYLQKPNGGVSSALNMGIMNMRGEYFSWLSHDDVYAEDKIEKQVCALRSVKENTIICCKYIQIDQYSKVINWNPPQNGFLPYVLYNWQKTLEGLLKENALNGCCLMLPRSVFEKCGMFDESLRFCQDVFMWYKVFLNHYSLLCTEDVCVRSRVHVKQLTQTGQGMFRKECATISEYLMHAFAQASNREYNFLQWYLMCDAVNLSKKEVRKIIQIGKEQNLLVFKDRIKAYLLLGYGKIRPILRKIYYLIIRRMKTR